MFYIAASIWLSSCLGDGSFIRSEPNNARENIAPVRSSGFTASKTDAKPISISPVNYEYARYDRYKKLENFTWSLFVRYRNNLEYAVLINPITREMSDSVANELLKPKNAESAAANIDYTTGIILKHSYASDLAFVMARNTYPTKNGQFRGLQWFAAGLLTSLIDTGWCGDKSATSEFSARMRSHVKYIQEMRALAAPERKKLEVFVLNFEKRTVGSRRNEGICRRGIRYMDVDNLKPATKAQRRGHIGRVMIAGHRADLPTDWADEADWAENRRKALEFFFPKIIWNAGK